MTFTFVLVLVVIAVSVAVLAVALGTWFAQSKTESPSPTPTPPEPPIPALENEIVFTYTIDTSQNGQEPNTAIIYIGTDPVEGTIQWSEGGEIQSLAGLADEQGYISYNFGSVTSESFRGIIKVTNPDGVNILSFNYFVLGPGDIFPNANLNLSYLKAGKDVKVRDMYISYSTNLESIESLPSTLQKLVCAFSTNLTGVPLPSTLQYLDVAGCTNLTQLTPPGVPLPSTLQNLNCDYSGVKSFLLPEETSIQFISISNARLSQNEANEIAQQIIDLGLEGPPFRGAALQFTQQNGNTLQITDALATIQGSPYNWFLL